MVTFFENGIVLTSNKIQNAPVFRLTYTSINENTINIKFELSQDGDVFQTYTEGKCVRKISSWLSRSALINRQMYGDALRSVALRQICRAITAIPNEP